MIKILPFRLVSVGFISNSNPKQVFKEGRKEGSVLFNDTLNTIYLWLYGVRHMIKNHSDSMREETRCCNMGYSFRLAARVLLYASSNRRDNTYHDLCYTSREALAGTSSFGGVTLEFHVHRVYQNLKWDWMPRAHQKSLLFFVSCPKCLY